MNVTLIVAIVLFVLGVLIKFGRLYFLIAGLNTMSDDERADYNLPKIGNLFFAVCSGMSAIIVIGYLVGKCIDNDYIEFAFLISGILFGLVVILVKINSSSYKNF